MSTRENLVYTIELKCKLGENLYQVKTNTVVEMSKRLELAKLISLLLCSSDQVKGAHALLIMKLESKIHVFEIFLESRDMGCYSLRGRINESFLAYVANLFGDLWRKREA